MQDLYSHHIFIFPFKWDYGSTDNGFKERTNLKKIEGLLKTSAQINSKNINLKWERFKFNWNKGYNESIYFHPYVRDILFDDGKHDTVLQYHIKRDGYSYEIKLLNGVTYELELEELTLNFYETGIGFFAFHLNNYH